MTTEEKQLLIKDLCARLPYGVIYHRNDGANIELREVDIKTRTLNYTDNIVVRECKPYLRPMSSMTEEEKKELEKNYVLSSLSFVYKIHRHKEWYGGDDEECTFDDYLWLVEWLLKHHFDFRDLIRMGLALEVPAGMYEMK